MMRIYNATFWSVIFLFNCGHPIGNSFVKKDYLVLYSFGQPKDTTLIGESIYKNGKLVESYYYSNNFIKDRKIILKGTEYKAANKDDSILYEVHYSDSLIITYKGINILNKVVNNKKGDLVFNISFNNKFKSFDTTCKILYVYNRTGDKVKQTEYCPVDNLFSVDTFIYANNKLLKALNLYTNVDDSWRSFPYDYTIYEYQSNGLLQKEINVIDSTVGRPYKIKYRDFSNSIDVIGYKYDSLSRMTEKIIYCSVLHYNLEIGSLIEFVPSCISEKYIYTYTER